MRATPYEVPFQARVELALRLAEGYLSVDDAARARAMLIEETALADEGQRLAALGLVHVGEHADVGVRPDHSDDHGVAKLGNRVRPPSTKIVWPVT